MLFDWSAACSADDPVVVVPWSDAASGLRFVDLREDPDGLDEIREAEQYPALLSCLRALNGPRSPVWTAKCDVWAADAEELAGLRLELGVEEEAAGAGRVCYVDLLCRDRAMFGSFHQQQHLMGRVERRLASLESSMAMAEAVVRPAVVDLTVPQEGYSVTLYVKAVGVDEAMAEAHWAEALGGVTAVLRGRELFPQT